MTFIRMRCLLVALATLLLPLLSSAQSGKDVVAPQVAASYDPVARGMNFQIAIVMKIRPGFHVNAREVTESYLIPTDVRSEVPAGFKLGDILYPKGTLQTFSFSRNKQLNVYTDTVVVHVPLTSLSNAPLGAQHIPLKLRYQACSNEVCLPPVTRDLEAIVNVVEKSSAAKPANAELFPKH
jgi:thiol:disulfide interchange protein DsbD